MELLDTFNSLFICRSGGEVDVGVSDFTLGRLPQFVHHENDMDRDMATVDLKVPLMNLETCRQLKGVSSLLQSTIAVFQSQNFNRASASQVFLLLNSTVHHLGARYGGFVQTAKKIMPNFPDDADLNDIRVMEDVLNSALRYFARFCDETAIDYLLIGHEIEYQYGHFSHTLVHALSHWRHRLCMLHPEFRSNVDQLPPLHIPSFDKINIFTDLLRVMRAQQSDHVKRNTGLVTSYDEDFTEQHLHQLAVKQGVNLSAVGPGTHHPNRSEEMSAHARAFMELRVEFLKLMKETQEAANRIGSTATAQIESFSLERSLPQKALRSFWMAHIHPRPEVKLSDLLRALTVHLRSFLSLKPLEVNSFVTCIRTALLHTDLNNTLPNAFIVTPATLHRMSRFVNPNNENLVEVLTLLSAFVNHSTKWSVPSFPNHIRRVYFALREKDEMINLLNSTGFIAIEGLPNVGKTTRLLSLIHSGASGTNRDTVYIDLDRVHSDAEAVVRLTCEFGLTNVKSMSDLLFRIKHDVLPTLRTNSLVVFDNVCALSHATNSHHNVRLAQRGIQHQTLLEEDAHHYVAFLNQLFSLFRESLVERRLSVCVVSSQLDIVCPDISFRSVMKVQPLLREIAYQLIEGYSDTCIRNGVCPLIDEAAIFEASEGLPGRIVTMLKWRQLKTIRTLAAEVYDPILSQNPSRDDAEEGNNSPYAHPDLGNATESGQGVAQQQKQQAAKTNDYDFNKPLADAAISVFANELSHDEKLLACCLYSHAAHFDPGLCWHMSREVFGNDIVRWKLAFDGLCSIDWLVYRGELGWCVSEFASLLTPTSPAISEQELYDNYVLHFVIKLVNIEELIFISSANVDLYRHDVAHFRSVFENVYICGQHAQSHTDSSSSKKRGPDEDNNTEDMVGMTLSARSSSRCRGLSRMNSSLAEYNLGSGVGGSAGDKARGKNNKKDEADDGFNLFTPTTRIDPRDTRRAHRFSKEIHAKKAHLFQAKPYHDGEAARSVEAVGSADAFNQIRAEFRLCYNFNMALKSAKDDKYKDSSVDGGSSPRSPRSDDNTTTKATMLSSSCLPRIVAIDPLSNTNVIVASGIDEPFSPYLSLPCMQVTAKELVGYVNNILVHHFTPAAAVSVAQALYNILQAVVAAAAASAVTSLQPTSFAATSSSRAGSRHGTPSEGGSHDYQLAFELSIIELAEQNYRAENYDVGLKLISKLVSKFYNIRTKKLETVTGQSNVTVRLPPYAARAMVCYGRCSAAYFTVLFNSLHRTKLAKMLHLRSRSRAGAKAYRADGIAALEVAASILADSGLEADSRLVLDLRDELAKTRHKKWEPLTYLSLALFGPSKSSDTAAKSAGKTPVNKQKSSK